MVRQPAIDQMPSQPSSPSFVVMRFDSTATRMLTPTSNRKSSDCAHRGEPSRRPNAPKKSRSNNSTSTAAPGDFRGHCGASGAGRNDVGCIVLHWRGYALAHGRRIARWCARSYRVWRVLGFSRSPGRSRGESRRCKRCACYGPSDVLGCACHGSDGRYREACRRGCLRAVSIRPPVI